MSFKIDDAGIRGLGSATEMRAYMEAIGQACEVEVKDLAPVASGDLRDSVSHRVEREATGLVATVFFGKFYGIFKEFGTSREAAKPFLRPGVLKVIGPLGGRLGDR